MILLSKKSEIKFHWMMTIVIYGLKIIGLAPFSYQIKTPSKNSGETLIVRCFRSSKIGAAYNVLILILYNIATPTSLEIIVDRLSTGLYMDYLNLMQCVVLYSSANVAMIFCTLRQNHAVSFMNRLLEVDRLLSGIEKDPVPYCRMIFVLFISHAIFNASVWFSMLIFYHPPLQDEFFKAWMWIVITRFVLHWFIIGYSVVLGLVARELRRVNINLSKIEKDRNNLTVKPLINERLKAPDYSTKNHFDPLNILLTVRTVLYEVSRDVAEYFSFPILPAITCQSFLFIVDCYFMIQSLRSGLALNFLYFTIAISFYSLSMLSLNVSKAAEEAKLTRWIIQKLLNTAKRQDAKEELEDFSLQLLHEDLSYTAYDIFTLDSTMLISILEAAASYLVIIIQSENQTDSAK